MFFKPKYFKISAKEAKALMDGGSVIVIDVRDFSEYNGGHIQNAVCLPLSDITRKAPAVLTDKNAKILVHCESGHRSAMACSELVKMGYTDINDFGGIIDWPYGTVR